MLAIILAIAKNVAYFIPSMLKMLFLSPSVLNVRWHCGRNIHDTHKKGSVSSTKTIKKIYILK